MSIAATSRTKGEDGILFSAPMILSLLNTAPMSIPPAPIGPGAWKWQTRRLVDLSKLSHGPKQLWDSMSFQERLWCLNNDPETLLGVTCPFGPPGKKLWVRENYWEKRDREPFIIYAATPNVAKLKRKKQYIHSTRTCEDYQKELEASKVWRLRPSIFMYRWASRIELEVTGIRAEVVQAISEADAEAEGVRWDGGWVDSIAGIMARKTYGVINPDIQPHQAAYAHLWDELHAKQGKGWLKGPHLVWVIDFRRTL